MTDRPATVRTDTKVRDAAHLMQTLAVRHLPVLDAHGVLVGMVSDRDLHGVTIPKFLEPERAAELREALEAPVATIMSRNVVSVGQQATASQIVALMIEHRIGAVPVVDPAGSLVGIVSYMDVLRHLPLYED
jgi:acetoin utilization protein AcuB